MGGGLLDLVMEKLGREREELAPRCRVPRIRDAEHRGAGWGVRMMKSSGRVQCKVYGRRAT